MSNWWVLVPEDLLKLVFALAIGALIGAEREFHDKAAGLRTIILICVGSTLFTIFSVRIAGDKDPGRVAAQIVTGVGFIGAGVILHRRGQVRGLTTASAIWIAAALGIGAGTGYLAFTGIAAVLALLVLWVLPKFEDRLEMMRTFRTYRIITALDLQKPPQLAAMFRQQGLKIKSQNLAKHDEALISLWQIAGHPDQHQQAVTILLADPDVHEFEY